MSSEEILSESERSAILGQVFTKKEEAPKVKESKAQEPVKDPGNMSFGELMERAVAARDELAKEDAQDDGKINEVRKQAILTSRMDILKDFRL